MFRMSFFFIAVKYFTHTRISSRARLLSWIIIYVVPTFYIHSNYSNYTLSFTLFIYLVKLLAIYNFYEVGYIQNDTETIKKETNPSLRLTQEELTFYNKHRLAIYLSRIILGLVLQLLLLKVIDFTTGPLVFCASTWLILLIYLVYNNIRNRLNLFLHFFLVTIRFLSYPLLFIPFFSIADSTLLLLIFPIINLCERGAAKRFHLPLLTSAVLENGIDKFRMQYYLVCTVLMVSLSFLHHQWSWIALLSGYFLVYRTLIWKFRNNSEE